MPSLPYFSELAMQRLLDRVTDRLAGALIDRLGDDSIVHRVTDAIEFAVGEGLKEVDLKDYAETCVEEAVEQLDVSRTVTRQMENLDIEEVAVEYLERHIDAEEIAKDAAADALKEAGFEPAKAMNEAVRQIVERVSEALENEARTQPPKVEG